MEVSSFLCNFGDGGECIQLKLCLVEQLAIAITVFDEAEWLFLIHFMLLDLLNLVLLIALQDIPSEMAFVAFESGTIIARVEMRRKKLLEVFHVHEFWVDLIQHLLIIALLQQVLVLTPKPKESRVDELQGDQSRQLHNSPVFPISLKDLQRLPLHEENIGKIEAESPGTAEGKAIQDFFEPSRRLLAVSLEHIGIWLGLVRKATWNTKYALARVFAWQMAVRIDGFLQVSHHEGGNLYRDRCGGGDRHPLQELVTHIRWLLKLLIRKDRHMKSIQLIVDQSSIRRSGLIARRTTKSERVSRSQVQSLRKKVDDCRSENQQQLDIYFDKTKRKSYFRSVIDTYFVPNEHRALALDSQPNIMSGPPLLYRECMSSESSRVKPKAPISISRLKLKSKLSLLDFSMPQMSSLPVIEEGLNGQKRPTSVQHPSSFISIERANLLDKEKDMEESLYIESNKSLMDNSQVDLAQSFKLITIRKGGKRLGNAKVYSSNDHKQLKRQNSAKKVGMQVLWTSSANNTIEFPNYKTLREMCYSIVEDKNGEEPISLIYPSAYYSTLFANQCEELIDIVVSLVKGVSKGRGMVANNQIHMRNITKHAEKEFVLTDWGCASIRQDFTVQGHTFNKQLGALCRDGNKWLVSPQYLAPEILKATQTGSYDHLWGQKGGVGSCDIWSIGCLIFELVTLVPLDTPYYCVVKGRDRKRGLFGNKLKSAEKILSKQRGFRNYALRCIRQQMRVRKEVRVNEKLLELLPRMLEENVECRASASEILMRLT